MVRRDELGRTPSSRFGLRSEAGAGAIELDARRTADEALVVHHDPVLADGRPLVACRRDELPAHVPTLAAALDACAGTIVNIEIKNLPGEADFDPTDAIADAVVALLGGRAEPIETWLISSFRRETIDRCHALDPRIATGWLTIGPVADDDIAWAVGAGHAAIHPWDPTVDRAMIDRCHDAGLRVNTWTCNESGGPSSWRRGASTASAPTFPTSWSLRWRPRRGIATTGSG